MLGSLAPFSTVYSDKVLMVLLKSECCWLSLAVCIGFIDCVVKFNAVTPLIFDQSFCTRIYITMHAEVGYQVIARNGVINCRSL